MNLSLKTILVVVFCCLSNGISAQNIKIFFPQFVGKEYVFILNEGLKRDTVQSGIVGETGFVTVELKIPEKNKGYAGIGTWSIVNGRGINFVINNEDFSITCEDSIPDPNTLFYKDSKENELMNHYEAELFTFYQKMDSIFRVENITENRDSLPPSFLKGMQVMNREYSIIRQKLVTDTSYAAFFWRTLNYMRGLGNRIYYNSDDEKEYFVDLIRYLADEINVTYLYHSGFWNPVITTTFNPIEDKVVWGENMVKMLKRTIPQHVFDAFSYDLITICEQFNWTNAEQVILAYLETSGRLPANTGGLVSRAILQNKVKIGEKAPKLNGEIPTNAILIFYESGCTHCQHQLTEITKRYSKFVEEGIRVISISTDESKDVYEYHSKAFPWPDKLCDFQGFQGENLKNYAVVGTPTIYLIDEKGIISDRQARLEDIKALNLN
jgi:peroxiredoxin